MGVTDTDLVKDGEGLRLCTYLDTMGIKTTCYGYNLQSHTRSQIEAAGGNYNTMMQVGGCTTQSVCNNLLETEMGSARAGKVRVYGSSVGCRDADAVLVDFVYNLGEGGARGFPSMNAAIKRQDWNTAAYEMGNSAYCRQVGRRCTRN